MMLSTQLRMFVFFISGKGEKDSYFHKYFCSYHTCHIRSIYVLLGTH